MKRDVRFPSSGRATRMACHVLMLAADPSRIPHRCPAGPDALWGAGRHQTPRSPAGPCLRTPTPNHARKGHPQAGEGAAAEGRPPEPPSKPSHGGCGALEAPARRLGAGGGGGRPCSAPPGRACPARGAPPPTARPALQLPAAPARRLCEAPTRRRPRGPPGAVVRPHPRLTTSPGC